ncbi:plastin-1-like [Argopecten irradians]|uniref:plastin-1-like n=1 Tax=Argopecten irradians TaxID=31199 RepID=UPI00371D5C86
MEQSRASGAFTEEQILEAMDAFKVCDEDGSGKISSEELGSVLHEAGIKIPAYRVRLLLEKYDTSSDGKLNEEEFLHIYKDLKAQTDIGHKFKKAVNKRQDVATHGGTSEASVAGTTHSVKHAETKAYAEWINRKLQNDPDCGGYGFPISEDDLFKKTIDGVLLCKLINHAVPETIDERTINKTKLNPFHRTENQNLAINSARAIGCTVINIGPMDIENGDQNRHLILGMLWQIIRIGLLSEVNITKHPNLAVLLREGETMEDLLRLSPEQILIRWVNYHLERANIDKRISNFTEDIKDSEAYIHLLHQIAPKDAGVTTEAKFISDDTDRAAGMLEEAAKIGCNSFVGPAEVVGGHQRLNLAFVANLFNNFPALDGEDFELVDMPTEETREEKTYRNWMNSLGVDPFVHRLYSDLSSGLVLFQLYDCIKPKTVDWKRVHKKFNKLKENFEKLENCNYVVELGCQCRFSLVGIAGDNILNENQTLTLALVWQLMRAYTLAILNKLKDKQEGQTVTDAQIIAWANDKLAYAGKKSKVSSFKDKGLSDGKVILDVIDTIKPGSVKAEMVKDPEDPDNDDSVNAASLLNAKYAISMSRKIGARVYALPEDIVEVKPKMIMTIFACLMVKDLETAQD